MHYRPLGNTGITVSEIGFGSWGIGGLTTDGPFSYGKTDDAVSLKAIHRALDLGITFFDTSNIYGYGHSEELLGDAFSRQRDNVVIASKVGFLKHGGSWNLEPNYVREELDKTLKRLRTDYLDLYQVHSAPISLFEEYPEYVETFKSLKQEGKIRAYGYSVKNPGDALRAIEHFGFETIQVNFSMIDERALECGIFDLAEKKKVGIIARTPFCFGFLTGTVKDLNFSKDDHRSTWPKEQLDLWLRAPELFRPLRERKGWIASELALAFCLGFKETSSVIPGILTDVEAEANARASDLPKLTPEELKEIIDIYKKHSFFIKK